MNNGLIIENVSPDVIEWLIKNGIINSEPVKTICVDKSCIPQSIPIEPMIPHYYQPRYIIKEV